MKAYYEKEISLRASDFDSNDIIKPSAILSLFQDVASNHAAILKMGYEDILKLNGYFILLRTKYVINNTIPFLGSVKVATWPLEKQRANFNREYEIYLGDEVVVKGISKWVIIDCNTRKIKRNNLEYNHEIYEKSNFGDIDKLKIDIPLTKVFEYKVMMKDIDHNKHFNNIYYLDLILEQFKNVAQYTLQIDYVKEALYNEVIHVYHKKENNNHYFMGLSDNDDVYFSVVVTT